MSEETLVPLGITVFTVFLMAFIGWTLRAAATGQIKRNAWFGLRTGAMMHCDECWLLGHHAAAQKGMLGCGVATGVMVLGAVASLVIPGAGFLGLLALFLGLAIMLVGLFLGIRDANIMLAKMHPSETRS